MLVCIYLFSSKRLQSLSKEDVSMKTRIAFTGVGWDLLRCMIKLWHQSNLEGMVLK